MKPQQPVQYDGGIPGLNGSSRVIGKHHENVYVDRQRQQEETENAYHCSPPLWEKWTRAGREQDGLDGDQKRQIPALDDRNAVILKHLSRVIEERCRKQQTIQDQRKQNSARRLWTPTNETAADGA